jgi:hypothetical protein
VQHIYYPVSLWVASIVFSIWLAAEKDRSLVAWTILAILFGPVTLIAIAGMPIAVAEPESIPEAELSQDAKPWNPGVGPPNE